MEFPLSKSASKQIEWSECTYKPSQIVQKNFADLFVCVLFCRSSYRSFWGVVTKQNMEMVGQDHLHVRFVLTEATPGYAGGEKELIARGGVDKKKSPS